MGVDVSGSKIKCCADAMLSEDRLSSVVMLDGDSVLSLLLLLCSFCVVSNTVLETSGFVTKSLMMSVTVVITLVATFVARVMPLLTSISNSPVVMLTDISDFYQSGCLCQCCLFHHHCDHE